MRKFLILIGFLLAVLVVGWLDQITGLIPDMSILYLLPVTLAAYVLGMSYGLFVSFAAAIAEIVAHPAAADLLGARRLYVDSMLHFAVFAGAAITVAVLHNRLIAIAKLQSQRDFDMGVARNLHDSLQEVGPLVPPGLQVAHHLIPARELGGDFIHVSQTPSGLFACIGDISGKGIAAALFTAVIHDALVAGLERFESLESLAAELNDRLCQSTPPEMFATAFLALVDPDRGLTFLNAGHEGPLLLTTATGEISSLREQGGLPLGVRSELGAGAVTAPFDEGDVLLAYTDGVSDSPPLRFKPELLVDVLRRNATKDAEEIADALLAAARTDPTVPQTDDIAILCLKRSSGV